MECIITFKNVADTAPNAGNGGEGAAHSRKVSRIANHASASNSESFFSLKSPQGLFSGRSHSTSSRGKPFHRPASSLSSPLAASHSFPPPSPSTPRGWQPSGHGHKRSVSILSIDSEGRPDPIASPQQFSRPKPVRGHGRSASVQVAPRRNESFDDSYRKGTHPQLSTEFARVSSLQCSFV